MKRYYFGSTLQDLNAMATDEVVGKLVKAHGYEVEYLQRSAWEHQICQLQSLAHEHPKAFAMFEFVIPRMGKRADVVLLLEDVVVVLEYKVGAGHYVAADRSQALDYAVDLKNFHKASHGLRILPVLVATNAPDEQISFRWFADRVANVVNCNDVTLPLLVSAAAGLANVPLDPASWASSPYEPTPTIVEAARALYQGHDVSDITRSEAGAENLTVTAETVENQIDRARRDGEKIICFVTGVPGSGKTLAGLDIATRRKTSHEDEHAVFLSGNGPLVKVLREALARDQAKSATAGSERVTLTEARRRASTFIQNIHHFRDEALVSDEPPPERVAVFDEAQRAWDRKQTSRFMREKRGRRDFDLSEPEFLLGVMDRHTDWCAVVCLVGGGQEINTGEAGIQEWQRALTERYPHWRVAAPAPMDAPATLLTSGQQRSRAERLFPNIHLRVSVRSFRAERLAQFVDHVLASEPAQAREVASGLSQYPLLVTRDLEAARHWLRRKARGSERIGLVTSSGALRLKPEGIHVKVKIGPEHWFLDPPTDVRSSSALEDAASEFDVQGLELDWTCMCWDANLRIKDGAWTHHRFVGSKWQVIGARHRRTYLTNAYRVLLTRARQGMIVYVPEGSERDATRPSKWYDEIADYLLSCGFRIEPTNDRHTGGQDSGGGD